MSIYRMRTEFGQHFKFILMGIAVIFVVGAIWQFGGAPPQGPEGAVRHESIATVNGMAITPAEFEAVWNPYAESARDQGVSSTQQLANMKSQVLMTMIEGRLLLSAAQKMGVDVSEDAVDELYEEKVTERLRDSRRKVMGSVTREQDRIDPRDDSDYINQLEEVGTSIDQQEENARAVTSRAGLEVEVAREGISKKLKSDIGRITDRDLARSYTTYKVRQILVSTTNLPAQQARNKAEKILREAKSGKDFATLARQNSDDGSKSQGGQASYRFDDLAGQVGMVANFVAQQQLQQQGGTMDQDAVARGQQMMMENPVALSQALRSPQFGGFYEGLVQVDETLQAVSKLRPGRVSGLIPTDMGFFIVKLESAEVPPTPALDAKSKTARRKMIQQVMMLSKWMDIDRETRSSAQISVEEPEMAGYYHLSRAQNMMMGGKQKDITRELALAAKSFERALRERETNGEAGVMYARILEQQGNVAKAVKVLYPMLEGSSATVQGGELRLWLGNMLLQDKKPKTKAESRKRALNQFRKASEAAVFDRTVHEQLAAKYKQLGMPDLAAKEQKWIADFERKMKAHQEREAARTERPTREPEKKKPGG